MLHKLLSWIKNSFRKTGFLNLSSFSTKATPAISDGSGKTKFYINDPITPNLIASQSPPSSCLLTMTSSGDKGAGYPLGSAEQQANACKLVLNNALSYMLASYRLISPKKISKWSYTSNLNISSRAGVDINAYYDRGSLRFFYFNDPVRKKTVYACDSTPVVAHEFGHAFLDILRPDFWNTTSQEVWAFHEAFGDMVALINSLQYDSVIKSALEETGGNLMLSNVLTRVGAEMGAGLYNVSKNKTGINPRAIRDISVNFDYVAPETISSSGPDNVLTSESHSFSRVFSGAFYEVVVKIADYHIKANVPPVDAMKISRDVASRYLLKAVTTVPVATRLFDAMARQMLQADLAEGGKYKDVLRGIFTRRNILIPKLFAMNDMNLTDVRRTIKDSYEIQLFGDNKVLRTFSNKTVKLANSGVFALNNNPLLSLNVEIPSQTGYYFDSNNKLIDVVESSESDTLSSAYDCLEFLNSNNLVGKHQEALFEIKGNKLVRTRIVCKCGMPNYCDPNAPEYGKPWKPKNNAGCSQCVNNNCLPRSCDCNETKVATPTKSYCSTTVKNCFSKVYKVGQSLSRKVCSN
jgi:hypothetical protein